MIYTYFVSYQYNSEKSSISGFGNCNTDLSEKINKENYNSFVDSITNAVSDHFGFRVRVVIINFILL